MPHRVIKLTCTACSTKTTLPLNNVRSGTVAQCAGCRQNIFLETGSADANVRRALAEARRMRLATPAY